VIEDANSKFDDVHAAFGRQLYGCRLLLIDIAEIYPIIKFVNRRAARWNRNLCAEEFNERADIWDSISDLWTKLCDAIEANVPAMHAGGRDARPDYTLFTDASTKGWGGLLLSGARIIKAVSGRWQKPYEPREMATAEMEAVQLSIEEIGGHVPSNAALTIFIDNPSVEQVLAKGHSKKYELNNKLIATIDEMRKVWPRHAAPQIYVARVATGDNPADILSRDVLSLEAGQRMVQQRFLSQDPLPDEASKGIGGRRAVRNARRLADCVLTKATTNR
jgi:hypothetical protein